MRDLLILLVVLPAIAGWLYLLRRWLHWWTPDLLLAVVRVIERPDPPMPERRPLAVASLKVWQTGWISGTRPASRPSTRVAHP